MDAFRQIFNDFLRHHLDRRGRGAASGPLEDLRARVPIARGYGSLRGTPVDRYYIERYLGDSAQAIRGRVLEIGDDSYTHALGGNRVTESDILHYDESNPAATFVGDLSRADHIPSESFDCIILTQTLHLIYDIQAALGHVHRLLRPGGALLATFPGISQISDQNWGGTWCWGWSRGQAEALLADAFPGGRVTVRTLGNRYSAVAFLQGMVVEEIPAAHLDRDGEGFAFLLAATAIREGDPSLASPAETPGREGG